MYIFDGAFVVKLIQPLNSNVEWPANLDLQTPIWYHSKKEEIFVIAT